MEERNPFQLYPTEYNNLMAWWENHKCDQEKLDAVIEEDCAPTYYSIRFYSSSIYTTPIAHCEICGARKDLTCYEERGEP